MAPIRVLVADDHTLVRAGICALLNRLDGFEVVAEASDGAEALALAQKHRPDVILTDISMPSMTGLELTARVTRELPPTRVLILSMHATDEYARQCFHLGASGYLLKDSALGELENALLTVARGETYLSPALTRRMTGDSASEETARQGGPGPLTPRQEEILRFMAQGLSTKAIARRLGISAKTVESHRAQLMSRLQIHELAGLVRYAIRHGLIDSSE